jgi:serine/threonine-protein kinase
VASQRLAGYLLEEQIGLGGMAVVYRATDERLGRRVALKLLAPALAQDTGFRQRFIRESRAAAAVDHPNIIPIYEAGETDGALFIAMRFVQGGDVRSLLERESPLSPDRVWSIVSQVASALDAAHEHDLVHRDVKPGNMLLDASGGRGWTPAGQFEHVYLSDFGISKQQLASAALTQTGQFVGTLDYIAPEQIESQRIDGRADQYSLACAAFELLAGTRPFRKDTQLGLITAHLTDPPPSVTSRRPGLPPAVDQVLAAAMAKAPAQRYATCTEFAADLGRGLGLLPGQCTCQASKPRRARPATNRTGPAGPPLPAAVAGRAAAAAWAPRQAWARWPGGATPRQAQGQPAALQSAGQRPGSQGGGWPAQPGGYQPGQDGGRGCPAARAGRSWPPPPPSGTGRRRSRWVIAATAAVAAVVLGGVPPRHRADPPPEAGQRHPPPATQPSPPDTAHLAHLVGPIVATGNDTPSSPSTTVNQAAAQNEANSMDSLLSSGATSSELLSRRPPTPGTAAVRGWPTTSDEIQVVRNQRNSS